MAQIAKPLVPSLTHLQIGQTRVKPSTSVLSKKENRALKKGTRQSLFFETIIEQIEV